MPWTTANPKPIPLAFFFGRKEWLENMRNIFFRNPNTVISDINPYMFIVGVNSSDKHFTILCYCFWSINKNSWFGLISNRVLLSPFATAMLALMIEFKGSAIFLLVKKIRKTIRNSVIMEARKKKLVVDFFNALSRPVKGILIINEPSTLSFSLCVWQELTKQDRLFKMGDFIIRCRLSLLLWFMLHSLFISIILYDFSVAENMDTKSLWQLIHSGSLWLIVSLEIVD